MKRAAFPQEARNFIMGIIYIIFAIYSIYIIMTAQKFSQKLLFGILFILIFSIALYAEYLRHLYQHAIQTIAYDAMPQKGKKEYDDLLKKDIFKAYNSSKVIYDTLYYADMLDASSLLKTLETHYKMFHQNIDNLLIWHYNQLYAHFLLKDTKIVQEEYTKIIRMKDAKVKGHKLSPLYNWDFIDALYLFSRKDYKQSFNCFKKTNTQNMNNREKLHYYYQFSNLCKVMHNRSMEEECIKKIKQIGGTSKIIEVVNHENE